MTNSQYRMSMMAAAISAAFAPTAFAAGAGTVDFATPGVNAVGPNGQARPLTKGSEIAPGETIDTGAGRAQLRFTDGGLVSLQPQTQFRLESYGYDKDDSSKNSVVMNMLKGGLRTITGLIGKTNRQGYRLQTATATVGIRGTEFAITGFPDGSILFHVSDGAIDVTNRAGSSTINGGQAALVTSQDNIPRTTNDVPYLPPSSVNLPQDPNPVQNSRSTASAEASITNPGKPMLTGSFFGQWRTATLNEGPDWGNYSNHYGAYGSTANNGNNTNNSTSGDFNTSSLKPAFVVATNGNLIGYNNGYGSSTTSSYYYAQDIGAAGSQLYGNDGIMAWGRWIGGPTTVNGGPGNTYTADNPLHWVVGLPVSALPTTGTATYTMYSGTAPSVSGAGAGGAISVGGSFLVNFGQTTGSFTMNFANSKDGANFTTAGTLYFDYGQGVNFVGGGGAISGNVANANTVMSGFLAGPAASHAGAVYNTSYSKTGNDMTNIVGAGVFKRGDITPTPTPPPNNL